MKTIKTATGIKKIQDTDEQFVSIQLRSILQDHRALLIDKMMKGLESYIDYKFGRRTDPKTMDRLKHRLYELKKSGIDVETYKPIFQTVMKHEYTSIGNAMFYEEIDTLLKEDLAQPDLFNYDGRRGVFQL
jgi:hypothetical protein